MENESLNAKTESVAGYQVSRLFSTEIKGDLLILFHKNPGLIDTFEGIARRIGRTGNAIQEDLRDLITMGILRIRKIGAHEVITFDASKDNEAQESILRHLKGIKLIRSE